MAAMLDSLRGLFDGQIDFAGQKRAELLMHQILVATGIIAFVSGFVAQSVQLMMIVFAVGLVGTLLAVVPPWPHFNRHPVTWLRPIDRDTATFSAAVTADKKGQ